MKSDRLYRIAQAGNDNIVLVRATNREQALRHIARHTFVVSLATDHDIYECGKRGIEIEDAEHEAADATEYRALVRNDR